MIRSSREPRPGAESRDIGPEWGGLGAEVGRPRDELVIDDERVLIVDDVAISIDWAPAPTADPPQRVLVVDDSPMSLGSVRHLLETFPGVEVVGMTSSARDALDLVDRLKPDLVLMDLAMPELDGLGATRLLSARPNRPRVVIMTVHDPRRYEEAARAAGADALLSKSELGDQLQPLIDRLTVRPPADEDRPA